MNTNGRYIQAIEQPIIKKVKKKSSFFTRKKYLESF